MHSLQDAEIVLYCLYALRVRRDLVHAAKGRTDEAASGPLVMEGVIAHQRKTY